MTSELSGEMFEGDSAGTCAEKFPLVVMGGQAEGLACADPGVRTPISASGNFSCFSSSWVILRLHTEKQFVCWWVLKLNSMINFS